MSLLSFSTVNEWSSSNEKSIFPSNSGSSSGSCIDSRKGWAKASSTFSLLNGFRSSILSKRSRASFGYPGKISSRGTLGLDGNDSMYFKAYSFVICCLVSASGVPLALIIRFTCSI